MYLKLYCVNIIIVKTCDTFTRHVFVDAGRRFWGKVCGMATVSVRPGPGGRAVVVWRVVSSVLWRCRVTGRCKVTVQWHCKRGGVWDAVRTKPASRARPRATLAKVFGPARAAPPAGQQQRASHYCAVNSDRGFVYGSVRSRAAIARTVYRSPSRAHACTRANAHTRRS